VEADFFGDALAFVLLVLLEDFFSEAFSGAATDSAPSRRRRAAAETR
jgi:hypothetical protein